MKITLQSHGITYTVESEHDDLQISDMAELFRGLLVQTGFHPATAESAFNSEVFQFGSWNLEIGETVDIGSSKSTAGIIDKIIKNKQGL